MSYRPLAHRPLLRHQRWASLIAAFAVGVLLLLPISNMVSPAGTPAAPKNLLNFGMLPMSFEPVSGQSSSSTEYQAGTLGGALYFRPSEVVLSLQTPHNNRKPGAILDPYSLQERNLTNPARSPSDPLSATAERSTSLIKLQWLNTGSSTTIRGSSSLPGRVNYLLGSDPANWRTNVPTYAALSYGDLYPGIDLQYEGTQGVLKGTYTVRAGADPEIIRWRYTGVSGIRTDIAGTLQIAVNKARTLTEEAPVAWQEIGNQQRPVRAHYRVGEDGTIGFMLGEYDHSQPLVIDPALTYSTFFGASGNDYGVGITVDGSGNTYITGSTSSLDFPLQDPAQPTYGGGQSDAFITKLSQDGSTLIYSTYLGGSLADDGLDIAVDGLGQAYVSGRTASANFPLSNPYQPLFGGGGGGIDDIYDAFVAKLSADGTSLLYSTYLGGSLDDQGMGIAVTAESAVITGRTSSSSDFPLLNAYQPVYGGGQFDAFVSRFGADGTTLVYSTFLGAEGYDIGHGIAADGAGNAYIGGETASFGFPTQDPFQPKLNGFVNGFITKINPAGSDLLYSTYLGGNDVDFVNSIAVSGGIAAVTGFAISKDFPTRNPIQPLFGGQADAFVTKLNATGSDLVYSTYLGGQDSEVGYGIAIDENGNAYVAGETASSDFPVVNPLQRVYGGGQDDSFLAKLNPSGTALDYSTYIGGTDSDFVLGIAVDFEENSYLTGRTFSTDYPVAGNSFDTLNTGLYAGFVTKVDSSAGSPPTPVPGIINSALNDQQAPHVDGAIAVWEDFRNGTWDVFAKNLATGVIFPVYQGPGDQRYPAISGSLIVWQDNRNGDWDIYAARVTAGASGPAVPIQVAPGDQLNPDTSQGLVVWQSGTLALATTTPQSSNRFDIVGAIFTDTVSQPISITSGSETNVNPAIGVKLDAQGTPVSLTVWQSHVLTMTRQLDGSNPRWGVRGMQNFEATPVPVSVPTFTGGDQTEPAVSDQRIIWQELYTQTVGLRGSNPRWGVFGITLPATPYTVTVDLGGPPEPAISGSALTWQDLSPISQTWSVVASDLISGTPESVSTDLLMPPNPDISRDRLVWQALAPGRAQSPGGSDLDIYGNVATPSPIPTTCLIEFTDVPEGSTFYTFIRCLACRGVISGYSNGTFRPGNEVTRGQIAKMVSLAAGLNNDPGPQIFEDVDSLHPFYVWVNRLSGLGYMGGYPCGTIPEEPCTPPGNRAYFRPSNNSTRGQLAKIVANAAGIGGTVSGILFADVQEDNPFYLWIMRLTQRGVIGGYPCGGESEPCDDQNRPYFRPYNNVTRGQASKIIANTFFPACTPAQK